MTARTATFRRKLKEIVEYPHHLWKPGFQGDLSQLRRKLRAAAINAGGGQVVMTGTDLLRVLEGLDHFEKANEWASSAIEALAPSASVMDDSADVPNEQAVNLVTTMGVANDNRFTAADVRRAIKAAEAGGKSVAAVDFPRQGGFRLLLGEPVQLDLPARSGENEWDDVLAS